MKIWLRIVFLGMAAACWRGHTTALRHSDEQIARSLAMYEEIYGGGTAISPLEDDRPTPLEMIETPQGKQWHAEGVTYYYISNVAAGLSGLFVFLLLFGDVVYAVVPWDAIRRRLLAGSNKGDVAADGAILEAD